MTDETKAEIVFRAEAAPTPDAAVPGIAQDPTPPDVLIPDGQFIQDPELRFKGLWLGLLPTGLAYGKCVRLMSDVGYRTVKEEISTIQAGFWFGTSTPIIVRWWIPSLGDGRNAYAVAAAWHDWLYFHRQIAGREITREEADDLFLEIMLYLGVGTVLAHTMWASVRYIGWIPWRRHRTLAANGFRQQGRDGAQPRRRAG